MDSLQDVIDYGVSKLPIDSRNDLYSLLMTMVNTTLAVRERDPHG